MRFLGTRLSLERVTRNYPFTRRLNFFSFACQHLTSALGSLRNQPLLCIGFRWFLWGTRPVDTQFSLVTSQAIYLLGSVSLLTLTAISIDRRLALILGLKYRHIVTLRQTCMTVIAMWLLYIVGTTLFFVSYFITLWYCNIIILSCLVTSIYAYTMIFRFLRCHAYKGQKTVYQG